MRVHLHELVGADLKMSAYLSMETIIKSPHLRHRATRKCILHQRSRRRLKGVQRQFLPAKEVRATAMQDRSMLYSIQKAAERNCDKSESSRKRLGWDTIASIHVARSLEILDNRKPINGVKDAVGVGGSRPITRNGYNKEYGLLDMSYIERGCTPDLLSAAKCVRKVPDTGLSKIAVFAEYGGAEMIKTTYCIHDQSPILQIHNQEICIPL